jgi:hypothetical protein
MTAQKSHGNAPGNAAPQALIENAARNSAAQPRLSSVPGITVANPIQNQKSSYISIFPFKAIQRDSKPFKGIQRDSKGFKGIQRDSKAFKAIQSFFRKKRLFIFSWGTSVGPSGGQTTATAGGRPRGPLCTLCPCPATAGSVAKLRKSRESNRYPTV